MKILCQKCGQTENIAEKCQWASGALDERKMKDEKRKIKNERLKMKD